MSYSPYAPPQSPGPLGVNAVYRPLGWKTTATIVAIVVSVVLGFVVVGLGFAVSAAGTPATATTAAIVGGLGLLLQVVGIAAGILFLVWMHHASTNAHTYGHEALEYEPMWSVAWWFIPIMSMWKPYQAMKEIWRASDPESVGTGRPTAWATRPTPGLFPLWWIAYVISGSLAVAGGLYAAYAAVQGASTGTANVLVLLSQVLSAVAGAAVIVIMRRLAERQAQAHAKLSTAPAQGVA